MMNTAAAVRKKGVHKSGQLGQKYGANWIMSEFIPVVKSLYKMEKRGYNYRICCLQSAEAVMPYLSKPQIQEVVIPLLLDALSDPIPNVTFSALKIIIKNTQYIDEQAFASQLAPKIRETLNNPDPDVKYYSEKALQIS